MTKTKLQFTPSPDADHHMVRIIINNSENKSIKLDKGVNEVVVESKYNAEDPTKSDRVAVFVFGVKIVDGKDVYSKARLYEFITTNRTIPLPPGELVMVEVEPDSAAGPIVEQPTTFLMVSGFAELFDGSMGKLNGLVHNGKNTQFPTGLSATFTPNTLRAGGKEIKTFEFYPGDPSVNVSVVRQGQPTITLADYITSTKK